MFTMFTFTNLAALALLATSAFGAITPTSPDSTTVVKVGENINALWTADSTGSWNNVEIQLMTGDNLAMVPLATLATGVDGTKTTTFSCPAPDVSPYSAIYFLQFTLGGDVSTATWTTRFTIAGADGSTSEPTNMTNYNGQDVKWGSGVLVGGDAAAKTNNGNANPSSMSASGGDGASSTAPFLSGAVTLVDTGSASSTSGSMTNSATAMPASSSGAGSRQATVTGLGAFILGLSGLAIL